MRKMRLRETVGRVSSHTSMVTAARLFVRWFVVIRLLAGVYLNAQNLDGSLSIVSPPEAAPVPARLGIWNAVPGLSTGVASAFGDNL